MRKDEFVLALSLTLVLLLTACLPDLSPGYGVRAFEVKKGSFVYLKRESRGLSYDRLSVSLDSDPCRESVDRDYYFTGMGPHRLYVRVNGGVLHVYGSGELSEPSKKSVLAEYFAYHELSPLEHSKMIDGLQAKGLTEVEVEIDDRIKCSP